MVRPASEKKRPRLWLAASNPAQPAAERPPPVPSLDDAQLLEALRRGDASAAVAFHDRVQPQVARTITRLLGRTDADGEDLAQLALIELVTTIARFRGECSLDSWTATVTARVVYKHIRRRKTERRIFDAIDFAEAPPRSVRSLARDTMIRSMVSRVRKHLESLDPNKAWTFLLHDVCGYDLREIADITGVTTAAAQTRLVRGRRELHERIAGDPELADSLEETEGTS